MTVTRSALFLATCLLLGSCKKTGVPTDVHAGASPTNAPQANAVETVITDNKTELAQNQGGVLVLDDGSKFQTTLYHLKIIGRLTAVKKNPYFIMSGVGCDECDANTAIYVHSPSDGPMKNEGQQDRFMYPGRESDYENGELVYEGRMFFGDCVQGHPNALVSFDRFLTQDKTWGRSVTMVEVKADALTVSQLNTNLPDTTVTLANVQSHRCTEIMGLDRSSEP
jgi:hypothetical protein